MDARLTTDQSVSPLSRFRPEEPGANGASPGAGDHIGEVIESETTKFTAQARELNRAPSFGCLVRVDGSPTILGLVFNASTQSMESNRRPTAYGKTEDQLRREQPQIFELLKTEFTALVIGYMEGERAVHMFPPQPARIHGFVHVCSDEEVREFTSGDDFVRTILGSSGVPTDELVIATLKKAISAHRGDADYLVRAGKELSRLLSDDYDRLNSLIRRVAR